MKAFSSITIWVALLSSGIVTSTPEGEDQDTGPLASTPTIPQGGAATSAPNSQGQPPASSSSPTSSSSSSSSISTATPEPSKSEERPEPTESPVGRPYQCSGNTQRREVREMHKEGLLEGYINAFIQMSRDGSLSKYVNIHTSQWNHAHFNPRFLPFHRVYIKEFEKDIQARGGSYLPYWDWAVDSQEPWKSVVLTAEYFGSMDPSSRSINGGPFSAGVYIAPVGGHSLVRDFDPNGPTDPFFHQVLLDNQIMSKNQFSSFSRELEYGPHAVVHSVMGGQRGDMSKPTSPQDPLFWLHHAFIDKIWDDYQASHGYSFDGNAYNYPIDDSDVLQPFGVSISSVMQVGQTCASYKPQDFSIVTTGRPDDGTIRTPEVATNWLNNSIANQTFVEEMADETKKTTDSVNSNHGFSLSVNWFVASLGLLFYFSL